MVTLSFDRTIYHALRRTFYTAFALTVLTIILAAIVGLFVGAPEAGFGLLVLPFLGEVAVRNGGAPVMALPFTASAHEHVEPAFTQTVTIGANAQVLNPIDIPASGYLRSILLEVTFASGTVGVLNADGPVNLFQNILLQDVNGSNIFGPLDGYAAMLTNVIGGHAFRVNEQVGTADPATILAGPNPVFSLRIPVEISHHDGLGSLANQNSAANYKLSLTINGEAALTATPWTVDPTVTIKGWLETWTLPAQTDARGNPQMQTPPLVGTGMYWSSRSKGVAIGNNTVEFTRLGNLLRAIVFISRTAAGVRDSTVFPDPFSFTWDGNAIHSQVSQRYIRTKLNESIAGVAAVALPAGVFALLFNTSSPGQRAGDEDPELWLPTTQSSRLEINGNSALAGTIQVLTCEVAPYETDQTERYVQPNASGALAAPNLPTTQGR